MNVTDLPTVNSVLNAISAALLLAGRIYIKRNRADVHKKIMLTAVVTSAMFLISYLIYHGQVGSIPYERYDWTRPIYFAILIPHVILAAGMVPFILAAVWLALKGNFNIHKKIVRFVWPVWMFVSLSGIAVYLMLYQL